MQTWRLTVAPVIGTVIAVFLVIEGARSGEPVLLWLGIALLAVFALGGLVLLNRRRRGGPG